MRGGGVTGVNETQKWATSKKRLRTTDLTYKHWNVTKEIRFKLPFSHRCRLVETSYNERPEHSNWNKM
jgi:hypothetical protein